MAQLSPYEGYLASNEQRRSDVASRLAGDWAAFSQQAAGLARAYFGLLGLGLKLCCFGRGVHCRISGRPARRPARAYRNSALEPNHLASSSLLLRALAAMRFSSALVCFEVAQSKPRHTYIKVKAARSTILSSA